MNGKAILFEKLPDDPQIHTKIIIDTFGRFHRTPESTFRLGDELQADQTAALKDGKRKLTQMKEAIYNPVFHAWNFCDGLIHLDTKQLDTFMQKWTEAKIENLVGKKLCLDVDLRSIVQELAIPPPNDEEISKQEWNKVMEKGSQVKAHLDERYKPLIEIQVLVKELIELNAKNLDIFKQRFDLIVDKAKQLAVDYVNIRDLAEDIKQADLKRSEKHNLWIRCSTTLLKNLAKDILLVGALDADRWNPTILNEAIGLMRFIQEIFSNLDIDRLLLLDDVKKGFEEAKELVDDKFALLGNHVIRAKGGEDMNGYNTPDAKAHGYRKVSAKTVRELYVLNGLSQKVLNGRLKLDSPVDFVKVKSDIEGVLRSLHDKHKMNDIALVADADDNGGNGGKEMAWAPTMIAVVFDLQTGFLLTGASQPTCRGHFMLGEAANKLPHLQVGRDFERVIAKCYEHWKNQRCKEMKRKWRLELEESKKLKKSKDSKAMGIWSDQELKHIFPEKKPEVYSQLPAPGKDTKIMCWTVSGSTFELKPPCPRCAYLYSLWDFHRTEEFFNLAYIFNYLNGGKVSTKESKEFHCAETVAAAKIYAWRHEPLGFG